MFCSFLTGVQLLKFWRHITVCFEAGRLLEGTSNREGVCWKKSQKSGRLKEEGVYSGVNITVTLLTHSFPMHPFSTPLRYQKTLRFSDVFMG